MDHILASNPLNERGDQKITLPNRRRQIPQIESPLRLFGDLCQPEGAAPAFRTSSRSTENPRQLMKPHRLFPPPKGHLREVRHAALTEISQTKQLEKCKGMSIQDRKYVSASPTAPTPKPNIISAPLLRHASIPAVDSTSLNLARPPCSTKLSHRDPAISTPYNFDLDSGAILHVTAHTLEAAVERVEYFLYRLEERAAEGPIDKFLRAHDAADVPLAFFLRNRANEDVSCWLTRFE
jgi:hypothetical protein